MNTYLSFPINVRNISSGRLGLAVAATLSISTYTVVIIRERNEKPKVEVLEALIFGLSASEPPPPPIQDLSILECIFNAKHYLSPERYRVPENWCKRHREKIGCGDINTIKAQAYSQRMMQVAFPRKKGRIY